VTYLASIRPGVQTPVLLPKKKKVQVAVSLFLTGNERIKPENSQAWWHPTVHPATWEQRSGGSQ
jgi:hypothetical protein